MHALASYPNGDFNPSSTAYYFSPEHETAEQYRKWGEERSPWSETWLIKFQTSETFNSSLTQERLYHLSQDLKEFVWRSRRGENIPDRLSRYASAELLIGDVVGQGQNISWYRQDEVLQKFADSQILKVGGSESLTTRKSNQWCYHNSVDERLGVETRGKIHIDVFASKNSQDIK